MAWIWSVVEHGQGSQRGTALLHASRLARDLRTPLASDFSDVTTAMALGSQETIDSRIAALAVIGEQRLRDRLPEVFALTRGETDPALIAAALACAGLIGEPSGENWITDFLHHPHPMVRAAAEAAIARLQGYANGATP